MVSGECGTEGVGVGIAHLFGEGKPRVGKEVEDWREKARSFYPL